MTRRDALAGAGACVAAFAIGPARADPLALAPVPAVFDLGEGRRAPGALSFSPGPAPPFLRLRPGEPLSLDLQAPPDAPLALHWQGVRIANAADGAPPLTGPAIPAGERARIVFTPPDPGFFWGKPAGPAAGAWLARGLYLPLIVEEASPPPVDAQIVLALADCRLDAAGVVSLAPGDPLGAGRLGDRLLVNGAAAPARASARPNARIRLRLLNATAARLMILSVEGARATVIAIDGQPSEPFEPVRNTIPVAPGARFELMLDLPEAPGAARLIARGAAPPGLPPAPDVDLLTIAVEGAALPARAPFEGLPRNGALPPEVKLQNARRADLLIEGGRALDPALGPALAMGWPAASPAPGAPWRLDGRTGAELPKKPLFSVKRGTPVSLGFVNRTAFPQTTHVHGHVMRLLHPLDDGWEPYWRDAVVTPPGKTTRVAFLADNPGRWLIENADPDRAAAGLAHWFEVV